VTVPAVPQPSPKNVSRRSLIAGAVSILVLPL